MKQTAVIAAIFIILFSFIVPVQAGSVPPLINYQGRLTDNNGAGLTGGVTLEFNIYDAASNGNKVWGPQVFENVPLVDGHFNVILGTTDANGQSIADVFNASERYLGITYDGNAITPRQRILSTAYALRAQTAEVAEAAKSVTEGDVTAGTITAVDLTLSGAINTVKTNSLPFLKGYIKGCSIEWEDNFKIAINQGYIESGGILYEIDQRIIYDHHPDKPGGLYAIYIDTSSNIENGKITGDNLKILNNVKPDEVTDMPQWDDNKLGWYHNTDTNNRCIGYFYYISGNTSHIVPFDYHDGFYNYRNAISYLAEYAGTFDLILQSVPSGASRVLMQYRGKRTNTYYASAILYGDSIKATTKSKVIARFFYLALGIFDTETIQSLNHFGDGWFYSVEITMHLNELGNFNYKLDEQEVSQNHFDIFAYWWSPDKK